MESEQAYTDVREQVRRGNWRLLNRGLIFLPMVLFYFSQIFDPTLICGFVPLLATATLYWSRGFNGLATPEKSPKPDVLLPIVSNGILAFLSSKVLLPRIVDWGSLGWFASLLAGCFMVPMSIAIVRFEPGRRRWIWLMPICLLGSALPASFAVVTELNYRMDTSTRTPVVGTVTDRHASSGKGGTVYTIIVRLAEPNNIPADFTVTKETFQEILPGDTAELTSGSGALGGRWVHLDFLRPSVP